MARKKRKKSTRTPSGTTADAVSPQSGTVADGAADAETPTSAASESTGGASEGEPRRFRSYFELLEEKYADEEPPQVVAPEGERKVDPEAMVDRRHTPRPTRKPKPVGRERPARKASEKPSAKSTGKSAGSTVDEAGGADDVRSVTGMIRVDPEPPTPRIRQTQAIALDRNLRWVVVLAFLAGVVLTALVVFFLAGGDDDDFEVTARQPMAEGSAAEATSPADETAEPAPAPPFGSVTEIASESPLPEPAAAVASVPVSSTGQPAQSPPDASASDAPSVESAIEPVAPDATDPAPSPAPGETPPAASEAASEPAASSPPPSATPSTAELDEAPTPAEETPADASPTDEPPVVVPAYTPARKAFTPQPSYPAEAREQGEEGTVVLSGRVTADGDVVDARVVESAGPRLDRVALETFRTWQFQPAERDGVAVESPYRVSFRFALDRRPPPPPAREPVVPPPSPPPADESATGTVEDPLPFGGDFEPPQRRVSPLPSLPRGRAGEVGNLVLSVVVDRQGRVARIEIEQGVDPQVTEQAIEAVKRWRFQPATREGELVAVWHRLVLRL